MDSSAKILNGKELAETMCNTLKNKLNQMQSDHNSIPGLAIIIIGNNPASDIYVKHKLNKSRDIGILTFVHRFPESISQNSLNEHITMLNNDTKIHGIIVQLPIPSHINHSEICCLIDPMKDVDGFTPYNIGCLAQKHPKLRPCTPAGIMRLLETLNINLKGLHAVVVGASNIVGRPVGLELLLAGCTVTTCHRFTTNLEHHIRSADILVSAIGKQGIINSDWIKSGAIVIDVGITRLSTGKICGDIDFESASKRAGWITPVPGGVGPMTVSMLMENVVTAWQHGIKAPVEFFDIEPSTEPRFPFRDKTDFVL